VIGITGRIGAGKTTAARYLARAHGFHYLRYSQVLAQYLDGARTKGALQELGWRVMSRGLQRKLNSLLLQEIRGRGDYAVDGLRHPIDHKSLKEKFGSRFLLVYIVAPVALRFERVRRRRGLASMKDFSEVDRHPVERHVPRLRARADAVIQNESSVKQLYRHLDQLVVEVSGGGRP
jgi:dephospho-CoA kinase